MYITLYLSPMIPSYNINETSSFFENILEFTPVMDTEVYAIYQKTI
jgi:hypothetical protein